MAIDAEEFIDLHPKLFHVSLGSWKQVSSQGLLSASALLRQYGETGEQLRARSRAARPTAEPLVHPDHGSVWLNDQGPLSSSVLQRCKYPDDMTAEDWLEYLNERVYFWPTEERLARFLSARQGQSRDRIILEVDTRKFIKHFQTELELSPYNSGAPYGGNPASRVKFLPLIDYPFHDWAKKRGNKLKAIVEITLRSKMDRPELLVLRHSA